MNNYESYKKTDIPWLGEIPSHWETKKIGKIFDIRKEKNSPVKTKEVLSLSSMYGVSLYSERKEKGGNKPKENLEAYNLCYPGDILVNSMNIVAGSVGISNYFGAISPVYYSLQNLSEKKYSKYYLEYLFRNYNFQRSLVGLGKGIQMSETEDGRLFTVRMRISWDTLKSQEFPTPPIEEQIQIANYLDWKINEIDRLILIEKEQIKELENLKQKYIDKLIDSISNEFKPLKSIFDFGKGLSITKENLGENGVRCISYGEIHNKFIFSFSSANPNLKGLEKTEGITISKFAELKKNDFIFADTSEDLKGCGNFTFLENDIKRVYAGYHTVVAKPILIFNPRYVAYYLESNKWRKQIRMEVKGIKVYSITQTILKSSKLQLPEIDIQESVSKKIDAFVRYKNALISIMDEKISNLQALKQSLIAEVVTGKIDVRNITIPQYEKVETIFETDNIDETEVQDYGD
mgnify:CR=1 FL=1|jgi:TYPE I RESTRICTION-MODIFICATION SYSTEM SPECIFICITY SUBUNIT